jgi:hypothetical protein
MTSEAPEITVVCSAWHKQKNLLQFHRQHLQCLLDQTVPVRVIYVADGDLELQVDHPLVDVVRVPWSISTAQAANVGLSLTDTEFFCMLNLDDYFFSDALALLTGVLKEHQADAAFGDWEIRFQPEAEISRTNRRLEDYQPCRTWPPERQPGLRLGNGDRRRTTWGPAPVFRTQAVREAYGFARQFGNGIPVRTIIDAILWHRLTALNKRVMVVERVLGTYYSNPADQQEFRGETANPAADEHQLFDQYGARA